MRLAETPEAYEELSPLCQYMQDLLLAGMSLQAVVEHGYEFASASLDMQYAARQLKEASRTLGIDLHAQREAFQESRWRR